MDYELIIYAMIADAIGIGILYLLHKRGMTLRAATDALWEALSKIRRFLGCQTD